MQMNHNMGWEGIKDPSLINDKPGWNPLFHGSAIGKLQVPWKHTRRQTQMHTWYFWLFSSPWNTVELLQNNRHHVRIWLYVRVWFNLIKGAGLRLWGEGKSALCAVVLSSAQTDAQACGNDSLSPRMSSGCSAGPLQPAGEVSVAPYGAGKINNERKFSATAGGLASLSSKQNLET